VKRALALALVVLAAACSSGDDDDAAAPSTTTAPPASTTSTTEEPSSITWLCHPEVDDVCERDMDATVVAADGTTTTEPFVRATDAAVDCFYVYPTVSNDPEANSDLEANTEEENVVRQQAARLGTVCDLYAPMYRQATLTALRGGGFFQAYPTAYADVLAAWREYLASDNDGRGVILLGHSQGAAHLLQLLREEIDPDAAQRELIVSAMLAGTSAHASAMPHLPPCAVETQTGCVLSWSTYRDTAPPPATAFFARPAGDEPAICTNPAALGGGPVPLTPYVSASNAGDVDVDTAFAALPGLFTAECRDVNGFHHLAVTANADPGPRTDDMRADLAPEWGLHMVDVNIVMGDLVRLAAAQAEAYSAG
jgi:pimeloyl-ACP methyl ester carboxylesterase